MTLHVCIEAASLSRLYALREKFQACLASTDCRGAAGKTAARERAHG